MVVDVHLCWRAWLKFARRQRQKREKALSAPPPLDAPDETVPVEPPTPPPPTDAPPTDSAPPSPPPPVEPPPPTPPADTPAAPDAPQAVPVEQAAADATNKPRPAPKPLRDKSTQLPNTTLRGPVGQGGTTRLWELLRPPTQCLVLEFHALDGPRRIPPLVAVDA